MRAEDIAKLLLETKAVAINAKEPFRYTSGILSPIYCDNRILISFPEKRQIIVDAYCALIEENNLDYDVIGGTSTAGIPWSAWIANRLHAPMVYIRGKAKEHGKKKQVEGHLDDGAHVVIVEDLISTGGSSIESVQGVRNEGGMVTDVIAIFTYGMEKARTVFETEKVTLHTMTNFETLVQVAFAMQVISEEEKIKVLEWNKDPQGWGKKMGYE